MSGNSNQDERTLAALGAGIGILAGAAGCVATAAFGAIGGVLAAAGAGLLFFFLAPVAARAIGGLLGRPGAAEPVARAGAIPEDRIDALTGLANANGLAAWFAEQGRRLEKDGKGIFALLADLDGLGEIERRHGKPAADAVIVEVAGRVGAFAGDDGIAARTDGSEFVAVVTVVPTRAAEQAEERAGQLAGTITRPVEHGNQTIWIGGSVGAAAGSPVEGEAVLERARKALAAAKRLGPGRYVVDTGK